MPRETQDPVITNGSALHAEDKTYNHPAYGMIGAYRTSGRSVLYGSDFVHDHYITVRIKHSDMRRGLSNDWYHGGKEIVEINLSEAQWAAFVSSMNVGDGVPCTLSYIQGQTVPGIPEVINRKIQFSSELESNMKGAVAALKELAERIETSKLSGRAKDDLNGLVHKAIMEIGSNSEFVAEQFGEHMEESVSRAKTEIAAFLQTSAMRLGLEKALSPIDTPRLTDEGS